MLAVSKFSFFVGETRRYPSQVKRGRLRGFVDDQIAWAPERRMVECVAFA